MASNFMIGTTVIGLESLDELTTPLPDPQHEFHEFMEMKKLGDLTMRGVGPQRELWKFPLLETEQITQLETFQSISPIYIQAPKRDDSLGIFEVLMNWNDPRQDGLHQPGFRGYRNGLEIEFIILSEVVSS